MSFPVLRTARIDKRRGWHALFLTVAMLSFALNAENARAAAFVATDVRVVQSTGKFDDALQYAVVFKMRPPRRLRAHHFEVAIGSIVTESANRNFVSLGPVWRRPILTESTFFEFGLSPTVIDGSTVDDRSLGGHLHFTSSASIGTSFGRRDNFAVSLRIQHTSNGGLRGTNPGLDMVGLNFSVNFNHQ